ncbi:hypothetical protein CEW89_08610 [Celeribacter ethanolicus]|uniref:Uncharacterized protein n=1 Tax=Celeribacter ethanolicus TaxID=1758178 RepID=A0A291GC60_9RHOB|nr:hypothetical protein [Celeribacter ethanolicus]ATG47630.1 hypothetical protein CEW89_08610 [Celeribacter ethanolicus]
MGKITTTPETKAARQLAVYLSAGVNIRTRIKPDGEIILEPIDTNVKLDESEIIDLTDFKR